MHPGKVATGELDDSSYQSFEVRTECSGIRHHTLAKRFLRLFLERSREIGCFGGIYLNFSVKRAMRGTEENAEGVAKRNPKRESVSSGEES